MPAVGGYFDTPSGAGTTNVPLDFSPGLVIFLTCNATTEGWHDSPDGDNPYLCVGFGSWGDLAQSSYVNGCQLVHFSVTGDGDTSAATVIDNCIELRATRNAAPNVAATITDLGEGFTLTWSASVSGYRVYYLAVTADEAYGLVSVGTGQLNFTGFSQRPSGGFGFTDPYGNQDFPTGHLYNNFTTMNAWSWSAYQADNAEESLSSIWMARGQSYDQRGATATDQLITAWDLFTSSTPEVAGTLVDVSNSLTLGTNSASMGTGRVNAGWVSADPSSYFSQTFALTGNVSDVYYRDLEPANPTQTNAQQLYANWGFTMVSEGPTNSFHGPIMGVSFGLWAGDNDFHAAVAVGKDVAGGTCTMYNGRDYSAIAGWDCSVAGTNFIAGKIGCDGPGQIKITVTGKNGTAPHSNFNVLLGTGEDIRHLLPILGVGE